jgi:hypothetical protein
MKAKVLQAFHNRISCDNGGKQSNYSGQVRGIMMQSSFLRAGAVALISYLDKAGDAGDGKLKKLTAEQVKWIEAQSVLLKEEFGITEGIDY